MTTTSSIFVLKPIIDLLHNDVLQYTDQIRVLKARIEELEKDNTMLRETMTKNIKVEQKVELKVPKVEPKVPKAEPNAVIIPVKKAKRKPVIGAIEIKDDDYAKEAETFEPVNVVVVPSSVPSNPDEKVIVLQDEKMRKDYQKEYQRKYRQQKKEKSSK